MIPNGIAIAIEIRKCIWELLTKGVGVKVKFTLTMDDLTVAGDHYDEVTIDWVSEVAQDEVLKLSQQWITSQNFLTHRMVGLTNVGESSLTIEPMEGNQL